MHRKLGVRGSVRNAVVPTSVEWSALPLPHHRKRTDSRGNFSSSVGSQIGRENRVGSTIQHGDSGHPEHGTSRNGEAMHLVRCLPPYISLPISTG